KPYGLGSRRSVSIAPPQAGRGTDCPRRGAPCRLRQGWKPDGGDAKRLPFTTARRRRRTLRRKQSSIVNDELLDFIITQMLDVLIFFIAHRGTNQNCKNVCPDRRVRSWVMRKKYLE